MSQVRWLSADEVAERLGVTAHWVYTNATLRNISAKFGKYRRYRLSGIENYEANCGTVPGTILETSPLKTAPNQRSQRTKRDGAKVGKFEWMQEFTSAR